jgi:trk system potassium uptake protein TrkA
MQRYVVIGLGEFGTSVAETLYDAGDDVIAVDLREERVNRMAAHASRAVVGDGRERDILERIGAKGADAGIVSTGDDLGASILAVMALRDIGVKNLYVKVMSYEHARVLERLGVTETVFPERESGAALAMRLGGGGSVLNYVRLGGEFSLQEIAVPKEWIGKTLRQLALPAKYKIVIVAIHDFLRDELIPVPDPDEPLKDSDTLLLAGNIDQLSKLSHLK